MIRSIKKGILLLERCKGCGVNELVKNGKTRHGKQRYKCRNCNCNYSEGDGRLKHGMDKCLKVIKMYLEGVGTGELSDIPRLSMR